MAMLPGMIDVVVGIIAAGIVADPFVVGVDVGGVGVAVLVVKSLWLRSPPCCPASAKAEQIKTKAITPTNFFMQASEEIYVLVANSEAGDSLLWAERGFDAPAP
jgi:hypothetical protein